MKLFKTFPCFLPPSNRRLFSAIPSSQSVKPLILLDVDGVINILQEADGWKDTKRTMVTGYEILFSRTVVKKINDWSKIAEVRWLTTWDDKAQSHLAPALGLNRFELARDPSKKLSKEMAAFLNHKEDPTRPLCWIDDHLGYFRLDEDLWSSRNRSLFIKPVPLSGLTPKDISRVDDFLAQPDAHKNNFLEERATPNYMF